MISKTGAGAAGQTLIRDSKGQTSVEYALIISLIALVIVLFLSMGTAGAFGDLWSQVSDSIAGSS